MAQAGAAHQVGPGQPPTEDIRHGRRPLLQQGVAGKQGLQQGHELLGGDFAVEQSPGEHHALGLMVGLADAGVQLPATEPWSAWSGVAAAARDGLSGALLLCPPNALTPSWLRRLGDASTAFASGGLPLRGARRRAAYDRGFALSDHADWPGLHAAIAATGAQRVIVTHGSVEVMVRHLQERGLQAQAFETQYGGEPVDEAELAQQA